MQLRSSLRADPRAWTKRCAEMMNKETSNYLFSEYVEGWIAGDVARVAKTLDRDCSVIESHGPRFYGLSAIEAWIRDWVKSGNKVFEWQVNERIYENDQGAFTWFFHCIAERQEHRIDGISFVEYRNEKILKITEFMRTSLEGNQNKKPNKAVLHSSEGRAHSVL